MAWSQEVAETASDRHWRVRLDGATRGPLTFVELRRLASEGRITPDTLVQESAGSDWIPARDARGAVEVVVPREAAPPHPRPRMPRRGRRTRSPRPPSPWPRHVRRLGVAGTAVGMLAALFLLTPLGVGGGAAPKALTTAQVAGRTLPSVALVRGRRHSGSGFMIQPGILVTSHHVIEGELLSNVVIEFPNARGAHGGISPTLRFADPATDLAFLAIPAGVDPLPLAASHTFVPGQEILVVGSPGLGSGSTALRNAVARGILSTLADVEDRTYYQLDVAVNPGNSGGPVLDEHGRVIGMVKGKATEADHLAFAVPLGPLQEGLQRLGRLTEADARRSNALHRLGVAEQAVLGAARVYWLSMLAYVRSLDPRVLPAQGPDASDAWGPMAEYLEEVDREAVADVRLLEGAIREDPALPHARRERFRALWTTYTDLKAAVDAPEGSLEEYAARCEALGRRLAALEREGERDGSR